MGRPKKLIFHCDQCDKVFKRKINLEKHLVCHTSLPRRSRRSVTHPNWAHFSKQGFDDSEFDFHTMKKQESDVDNVKNEPYISDSDLPKLSSDQIQSVTIKLEDIKQENNFENQYHLQDKSISTKAISTASKCSIKTPRSKASKFQYNDLDEEINEDTFNPESSLIKPKYHLDCRASVEKSVNEENEVHKKNINSSIPKHVTCEECQLRFRNQKQLNDHINAAHEKSSKIPCMSQHEVQTQINADNLANKQNYVNPVKSNSNQFFVPNNNLLYIGQPPQPGVFYNTFPIQLQQSSSSFTNLGNISNAHFIPLPQNNSAGPVKESKQMQCSAADADINSEDIPKFDFDSETYMKWLKKFINECQMQTFPLSPALCNKISHINDEILDALLLPTGTLKKKENHFFLMSMQTVLSEIMMKQLKFVQSSMKK